VGFVRANVAEYDIDKNDPAATLAVYVPTEV
jgi:hypothetical protein